MKKQYNIFVSVDDIHVTGTFQDFYFSALVFPKPSDFGIEGGRVSKLWVRDCRISTTPPDYDENIIIFYDRDWAQKPQTEEEQEIFKAIYLLLESLPKVC